MTKLKEKLDKFFTALYADLDDTYFACPAKDFAKSRLKSRARKRARYNVKGLSQKAVHDFVALNASIPSREIRLDAYVESNARHFISVMMERYFLRFEPEAIQTTFDLELILGLWRFGPGASNGIDGTHTADKIGKPMTCNDSSRPLVRRLRGSNPYLARFDSENDGIGPSIRGSRLATVPKNEDTERTIAIEPSGNMCLQLAAGTYLEGLLQFIGLDIKKQQPLNKALAQRGSIDGSLATIDMKSASDLITPELVRRLLPPVWYSFLMDIRSKEIELPDGGWVTMNMMSTMGNGFTFPLMTLIFVALVYGNRCQRHDSPTLYIDWSHTAVFGDDIIVPTDEYESLCTTLESAGLIVNRDKSFHTGPFRESCGGDYYLGTDVTPFYVKSLASNSDVYVAINQVSSWMRKTSINLYKTLFCLKSLINGVPYLVPEWYGPDSGIQSSQVKTRFKHLRIVPKKFAIREDNIFLMMLCCGGYLESYGPHAFYTPRPTVRSRASYVVRESRLPRGYLDGWDPVKGSHQSSLNHSTLLWMVFS